MSRWKIRLPLRGRDQTIAEAIAENGNARLSEEDRSVALRLLLDAHARGIETTRELTEQLDAATPAQRRALLDQARQEAGLESTADIEGHEAFERANDATQRRKQSLGEPPEEERIQLSGGGGFVIPDRAAEEREHRADELREEAFQERQEARRLEAEAIRKAQQRHAEENRDNAYANPPPAGWKGPVRWDG